MRDEGDQARYVVDRVLENREAGLALKSQAVLFRTSHHSDTLEFELTRRNIPFVKFGGLKFLEAAHVKDVLAALRFAENPRDRVAGFRVTQLVPGIGPANAARILDRLAAPDPAAMLVTYAPPRAGAEWTSFAALFDALFRRASPWPAEFEQVRRWYEPHLERLHDDAAVRAADLAQLEQIAASYRTREQFLTDLTLDPPSASSDEAGAPLLDEDYLILSTIHSAKGQEWKSVFVLNAVDGCIPSDLATGSTDEIEEERRLLYVAMTRAKDQLDVIVPQRFYAHGQASRGDRYVHALRTRFIPTSVAKLFDQRIVAERAGGCERRAAAGAGRCDGADARDVAVTTAVILRCPAKRGRSKDGTSRRRPSRLATRSHLRVTASSSYCFFSIPSAATNGVLVAGPSPHTRIVAGSVFAPSKCTPFAQWITCVPAGIGTVASVSNLPPLPTHQVPESTMKKRSFGWKCGRLMLPGSQVSSIA